MTEKFRYGWRPELPDTRDVLFSAPLTAVNALPAKIDLRPSCPPVLHQGTLGSCTANAIASAHQFNQIKQGQMPFAPSRLFVYYNERALEGTIEWDSGAYLRDGFKSIAKQGVCAESLWPYNIARFRNRPTTRCYKDALKHQAISYARLVPTLSQLKGCLAAGFPFVFGFSVYASFESDDVEETGQVPLPTMGEKLLGGHAVLAVGYDDATQRFVIQNSWGTGWGESGHCFMPYSYLTDSDLSSDFWTLRAVEGS